LRGTAARRGAPLPAGDRLAHSRADGDAALRTLVFALLCFPLAGLAQETRELVGHVGSRSALMVLQTSEHPEGGSRVSGEYILLPTLVRRFVEGERSPQIGVTTLKEGSTPILFGRAPSGELRGTWRGARFAGN